MDVVRVNILVLFVNLEERLLAFHSSSDVNCGFVIHWDMYSKFDETFYHEWCWILPDAFSALFEMIMWCLFWLLLIWCITWIDLWLLNHPCVFGINSTWSWGMILFIYCWIWLANIVLRIFPSIFIKDYWSIIFSFFVEFLSCFGMKVIVAS